MGATILGLMAMVAVVLAVNAVATVEVEPDPAGVQVIEDPQPIISEEEGVEG